MNDEIKIGNTIQDYVEEFIPATAQIQNFLAKLASLYETEFSYYRGEASKEVEDHKEQLLKQISDLSSNYMVLSDNLIEIVVQFIEMDEELGNRIISFLSGFLEE